MGFFFFQKNWHVLQPQFQNSVFLKYFLIVEVKIKLGEFWTLLGYRNVSPEGNLQVLLCRMWLKHYSDINEMRFDWRVVKKGLNSTGLHHREDELSSAWFIKFLQLLPIWGVLFHVSCTSESPNLLASQTVPTFLIPKTPHIWLLVWFLFCYIKDYSFYWNFFLSFFSFPLCQINYPPQHWQAQA